MSPPSSPDTTRLPTPASGSRAIVLTEIEAMGGAERSVLALCRFLHERGMAHHVVTYHDRVGLARYATTPVEVVELRPLMRPPTKIAALRRYFARLHTSPKPLMSGYQPALHAAIAGLRGFHCLMHDTPSLFEGAPALRWQRRMLRHVSDTITGSGLRSGGTTLVTSEYLQTECRRVFGVEAKIARMGGLTGAHEFRPRPVRGSLQMLSVSRLEINKRLDWVLRTLAFLETGSAPLSQRVDWTLHIVGRGSQADFLQALARSAGLMDRVRFEGFLPDAQLEELYSQAHLFIMPAVQGYGIPAIEALSRGIPVLLHRDSGVSDILLGTPWATVFTGEEPEFYRALSAAVQLVLAGTQLHQSPPALPTEQQWAERVCSVCGWL